VVSVIEEVIPDQIWDFGPDNGVHSGFLFPSIIPFNVKIVIAIPYTIEIVTIVRTSVTITVVKAVSKDITVESSMVGCTNPL
jgi:hypothetical protein